MKHFYLALGLLLVFQFSFGQTNTFPASGNVGIGTTSPLASLHVNGTVLSNNNIKILGTDQAWAEGLVIVKPNGWSGIRITRNDPTTNNFEGNWAFGYNASTSNDFSISNNYGGTQYDYLLHISAATRNVGIGTSNPTAKLAVNGNIRAKEIKVEVSSWPDYVFAKSYSLPSLQTTEQFIKDKGHLPGIPSSVEVKANGIDLGDMNAKLLQKIEELTLHLIEKDKEIQDLKKLYSRVEQLEVKMKSFNEK